MKKIQEVKQVTQQIKQLTRVKHLTPGFSYTEIHTYIATLSIFPLSGCSKELSHALKDDNEKLLPLH